MRHMGLSWSMNDGIKRTWGSYGGGRTGDKGGSPGSMRTDTLRCRGPCASQTLHLLDAILALSAAPRLSLAHATAARPRLVCSRGHGSPFQPPSCGGGGDGADEKNCSMGVLRRRKWPWPPSLSKNTILLGSY